MKKLIPLKNENTSNPWTSFQGLKSLRRHSNGYFYVRVYSGDRGSYLALKTNVDRIALERYEAHMSETKKKRKLVKGTKLGTARLEAFFMTYEERIRAKVTRDQDPRAKFSQSSKTNLVNRAKRIRAAWPELLTMRPDEVRLDLIETLRDRAIYRDGYAISTVNQMIDTLRLVYDIALSNGAVAANLIPEKGIKAPETKTKKKLLPHETIEAIFKFMDEDKSGYYCGKHAAEFARLAAYCGGRLAELAGWNAAAWIQEPGIRIYDVDFEAHGGVGMLKIRGGKSRTSFRPVPMDDRLRNHLKLLLERRAQEAGVSDWRLLPANTMLLKVRQITFALRKACKALNCGAITHHRLRDAFATYWIIKGARVPIVASWMGHADNGALLLRTYFHQREADSAAEMARLMGEMQPTPAPESNVIRLPAPSVASVS